MPSLQIFRGTAAQVAAYTGPAGEPVWNQTTNELHLQDGATPGGVKIGGKSGGFSSSSLTDAKGYLVTTSLSTVGLNVLSGKKCILRSIHATNIGTVDDTLTCKISLGGTTDISVSNAIPIKVGSSVELLKKPKILSTSDIVKAVSGLSDSIQLVLSYEILVDTTLVGNGITVTTANTYVDLLVATSNAHSIESILLTNIINGINCAATVVWTNESNVIQAYLAKNMIVPTNGTIEILEQAKFLPTDHKIRVSSTTDSSISAAVAAKSLI